MLKLGVNIDHVATLRELRGTPYPDVLAAARVCRDAGAHGVTVHLREDRRHIRDADVRVLRAEPGLRLNLEMAIAPDVLAVALETCPDEACLVPERRQERTTEGGLDVLANEAAVGTWVRRLSDGGVRVSLFIEPDPRQVEAAARVGAPCIELHTGTLCTSTGAAAERELERLVSAARQAARLGLQVNAGHGINRGNLAAVLEIPHLDTLNIGHSIVCEAVFIGLDGAVRAMLTAMQAYRGGRP